MVLPYNVFGGSPHKRWIVADGGGWSSGEYCYTTKQVPQGPEDWVGPLLFPQEPDQADLDRGHSMASIGYDRVNNRFMITGTIGGAWDFSAGAAMDYPNVKSVHKVVRRPYGNLVRRKTDAY